MVCFIRNSQNCWCPQLLGAKPASERPVQKQKYILKPKNGHWQWKSSWMHSMPNRTRYSLWRISEDFPLDNGQVGVRVAGNCWFKLSVHVAFLASYCVLWSTGSFHAGGHLWGDAFALGKKSRLRSKEYLCLEFR